MRGKREIIHLFIDPTPNQAKTQQNSDQLDPKKGRFEAVERENHQPDEDQGKREKQSTTHQSENGKKSETAHEEEPEAIKNRVLESGLGPGERLKRHRREVAGQVWIPEMWGKEELLMDWIDCSAFDASLIPKGIISARASLIDEGRRSNSAVIRVQNTSC